MEQQNPKFNKELTLYLILSGFFLANALIAEMVGVKIFSVEKIFGISPMNLPFIGDLKLSVGILIWPFVFIISDLVNEYFGKPGVKRLSYLGSILIAYAFIIVYFGTSAPPSDFWLNKNAVDSAGNPFNIDYAYSTIFRQGLGIIVGSITAFLVGQIVDLYVFHYLRKLTGHKKLWLRATGSTVVSQLIDSYLILFIAFYLLGNWEFKDILAIGTLQYFYKISFAVLLTPLLYWLHSIIDNYLGKDKSKEMIAQAEEVA